MAVQSFAGSDGLVLVTVNLERLSNPAILSTLIP